MDQLFVGTAYSRTLATLRDCFSERERLIEEYRTAVRMGEQDVVEAVAEQLEATHQVQHAAFDALKVLSRHLLHVLDSSNAREIFEALSGGHADPQDPGGLRTTIRGILDGVRHVTGRSVEWISEELGSPDDDLMAASDAILIGTVMLLISENFHEVVDEHGRLTDETVEVIHAARERFPGAAVSPSDYIPVLDPDEARSDAERVLREYTERFLDPDMDMAYR